jgi:hypothetical protein
MSETKKATIRHNIKKPKKDNSNYKVLKNCVLSGIPKAFKHRSLDAQSVRLAVFLQLNYRSQMYRLIAAEPAKALQYTYQLNCRPPGFFVTPNTTFCNRPRSCPWCSVRQLTKIYSEFCSVPEPVRCNSRFVGWRRLIPFSSQELLPGVSGSYGPHAWLKAHVSAQAFLPGLLLVDGVYQLVYRHIGIHCVPDTVRDPIAKLKNRFKDIDSNFEYFEKDPVSKPISKLMREAFAFNWLKLFEPEQFSLFQVLNADFKRQRFIRINKYKGD